VRLKERMEVEVRIGKLEVVGLEEDCRRVKAGKLEVVGLEGGCRKVKAGKLEVVVQRKPD
jgi:hypothetical protein